MMTSSSEPAAPSVTTSDPPSSTAAPQLTRSDLGSPTVDLPPRQGLRDVLYHLRDHLAQDRAFGSLHRLARCSREYQNIFGSGLENRRITLRGERARDSFADILGARAPSPLPRQLRSQFDPPAPLQLRDEHRAKKPRLETEAYDPLRRRLPAESLEPWEVGRSAKLQSLWVHRRRLRLISQCEALNILDFHGAEAMIEAAIATGEGETVFKNMPSLCLGPDLLWRLAEQSDSTRDMETHLLEHLRPKHVCFSPKIGNKHETMDRLERIGYMPSATNREDAWTMHYLEGVPRIIQHLCETWAPETITIHNLTAENIPAVQSSQTTVFFGPDPPPVKAMCETKFWRADVRASEIANGIVMQDGDERAVFVGVEEFFGREGVRESEIRVASVEERVWKEVRQPYVRKVAGELVRFLTREEADKCRCCGKK